MANSKRAASEIGTSLGLSEDLVEMVERVEEGDPHYTAEAELVLGSAYVGQTQQELSEAYRKATRTQNWLTAALIFFTAVQAAGVLL